jgi:hypothetical protein
MDWRLCAAENPKNCLGVQANSEVIHEIHKTNVDRGDIDRDADAGNGSARADCFHFHSSAV